MDNLRRDLLDLKTKYSYELEKEIQKNSEVSFDYVIKKLLLKNKNLTLVNIVTFKVHSHFNTRDYDEYEVYDIYYGLMDKEKASIYPNNIINLVPESFRETDEMYDNLKKVLGECEYVIKEVKSIPTSSYSRKHYKTNFNVFPDKISLFGNKKINRLYLNNNYSFITGTKDIDYEALAFQIYDKLNKEYENNLNKKINELKNIRLKLKNNSNLTSNEIKVLRKLLLEEQKNLIENTNLLTYTLNKKRK